MPIAQYQVLQILAYAPLLPIIAVGVVAAAWRSRDPCALEPARDRRDHPVHLRFAFIGGSVPFFRYLLPAYPLGILGIGLASTLVPAPKHRLAGISTATFAAVLAHRCRARLDRDDGLRDAEPPDRRPEHERSTGSTRVIRENALRALLTAVRAQLGRHRQGHRRTGSSGRLDRHGHVHPVRVTRSSSPRNTRTSSSSRATATSNGCSPTRPRSRPTTYSTRRRAATGGSTP